MPSSLESLHKTLLDEWKKNNNLDAVWKALTSLKAELNNNEALSSLQLEAASTIHSESTFQFFNFFCWILEDYFEINALYNVVRADMAAFEEAISDVHSFYQCQQHESTNKYLMFGLHLMYLIAANKLSDFHMVTNF